ncbi:polyphosphate kinase 2 [Oceaniferula marina]|nr:polyphosphate kinase 2 [Oceaniferula marina]
MNLENELMSKQTKKDKGPVNKKGKLRNRYYEAELERLQTELVHLQDWVKHKGLRVVIVFEGRDAAGKGGIIKRIRERVSPRVFRVEALPAPNDREEGEMYLQRYISKLPTAGEIVLFDRSWYNRLGVEKVMGFCSDDEYEQFKKNCAGFERWLVEGGTILVKYWLTVSNENQEARFKQRIRDKKRQWKLSPMDLTARSKWFDYSRARDAMLEVTDTKWAPWHIVDSNDKKRARLNCMAHLLDTIPYEVLPDPQVDLPERDESDAYDDVAALAGKKWIPERY